MKKYFLFFLLFFLSVKGNGTACKALEFPVLNENCPKEEPFFYYDKCIGCNEQTTVYVDLSLDFNSICTNREIIPIHSINSYALSRLKECSTSYPLRGEDGSCYSCNETKAVVVGKKECNLCPNREVFEYEKGKWDCRLKECPESYFRWGGSGNCVSCRDNYSIYANKEECEACSDRKYIDGSCVLTHIQFLGI